MPLCGEGNRSQAVTGPPPCVGAREKRLHTTTDSHGGQGSGVLSSPPSACQGNSGTQMDTWNCPVIPVTLTF